MQLVAVLLLLTVRGLCGWRSTGQLAWVGIAHVGALHKVVGWLPCLGTRRCLRRRANGYTGLQRSAHQPWRRAQVKHSCMTPRTLPQRRPVVVQHEHDQLPAKSRPNAVLTIHGSPTAQKRI